MGDHILGAPPTEGPGRVPAENMPMPHPGGGVSVKGSVAPIKSTGKDNFATSQPSNKENVKSGQAPI